jgi:hypothetical protein
MKLSTGKAFALLLGLLVLGGCEAPVITQSARDREMITAAVAGEKPGDYYVGRRFYKVDYKVWGWVKKPGEPWKSAQLVMLNEQRKLAPDREKNDIGSDNDYEYRLSGRFSGEKVYEPASDRFYPEFVLSGATVISTNPPLIFPDNRWTNSTIRLLGAPEF